MDDSSELAAWCAGDEEAGLRLFRCHFDVVARFFATKVDQGAEDLAQRTFLACQERRDRWPPGVEFRVYLLGIARKLLLRRFRELRGRDRPFDPLEASVAELAPSPSSVVHARREAAVLVEALRQLPLDQQIAVELHYWEGLSAVSIAQVLGIAEGTAKSRLRRARQRLSETVTRIATDPELARCADGDIGGWLSTIVAERGGDASE